MTRSAMSDPIGPLSGSLALRDLSGGPDARPGDDPSGRVADPHGPRPARQESTVAPHPGEAMSSTASRPRAVAPEGSTPRVRSSPTRPAARKALAAALKQALATTSLDKITVAGLSRSAGVTRQAFYYHFLDVPDLAVWVFTTEVADHILAHRTRQAWAQGFVELLGYLRMHREQIYSVIRALSSVELEQFFYRHFRRMMASIVGEVEESLPDDARGGLNPHDRQFIIDHYAIAVVGHLLHWLATDMRDDPRELVANLQGILDGGVLSSLKRFAQETPSGPDKAQ